MSTPGSVPNEYTRIIVDEAHSRGLGVEIRDPATGEMVISSRDRAVHCIQSLSERTSAIAYLNCTDKARTRSVLSAAGLIVPDGRVWTGGADDLDFVDSHGRVVVKPRIGEGGAGVSVGVGRSEVVEAVESARLHHRDVLVEAMVPGSDLRVLVIDGSVVAASVRRPPIVIGDGASTIDELIAEHPVADLDDATSAHLRRSGRAPDDVAGAGEELTLRGTANVHTGGSICDVTAQLSGTLRSVGIAAAAAVGAPVAGVDCIVDAVGGRRYAIIEVNEQPGLANHEPQPTAARYLDFLFPGSAQPQSGARA